MQLAELDFFIFNFYFSWHLIQLNVLFFMFLVSILVNNNKP